jgi:hypothetical protein
MKTYAVPAAFVVTGGTSLAPRSVPENTSSAPETAPGTAIRRTPADKIASRRFIG